MPGPVGFGFVQHQKLWNRRSGRRWYCIWAPAPSVNAMRRPPRAPALRLPKGGGPALEVLARGDGFDVYSFPERVHVTAHISDFWDPRRRAQPAGNPVAGRNGVLLMALNARAFIRIPLKQTACKPVRAIPI